MGLGISRFGSAGGAGGGSVTGLTNPLIADLDGGSSFGLKNLDSLLFDATASAKCGWSLDVYLGMRTDGKSGSGLTPNDAIDISTPDKLDSVMKTNGIITAGGCRVNFPGGAITTWGGPQSYSSASKGFNLPGGNWYRGCGEYQTTVQANALSDSGQICLFQTLNSVDNKNTRISDMKFDTRWPSLNGGSPPVTSVQNWIEIDGSVGIEVDHCSFVNGYGNFLHGQEHFGVKLTGWVNTGVNQPVINATIHDCSFGAFQGDYGGPAIIWSIPANLTTTMFQASCSVHDNYFQDINWLQLSGATSGVTYCVGAQIGQGCEIYGNNSWNCGKFYYNEGGTRNIQIHHNMILNCIAVGGAINLNPLTTSIFDNIDIFNNHIEVSTVVSGIGGNSNNLKIGISAATGSSVANNIRIRGNTITRKLVGVNTATRARNGSNVATITFSTPPGFNTGDTVDTSGFGGSGYNLSYVTLTKNSPTSYSFPCTGSLETTQTDTTGTVACACYGIGGASIDATSQEISGNQIGSAANPLYNYFVYTSPLKLIWKDNTTLEGAPILLTPGVQSSLPNVVRFPATNNYVQNGTNLIAAYAHAKLINPNSAAASATNRITVLLEPSSYDLGSSTIAWSSNYIDLMGTGMRDANYITSSSTVFTVDSNDYRFKTLWIKTSSSSASVYGVDRTANGSASEIWEDVIVDGAGTYNSVTNRASIQWSGTYRRVKFANGGFFGDGQGQLNGLCENIEIGANGTSNFYMASGSVLRNFTCAGQMNMFSMNGRMERGWIKATGTNQDAILEGSTAVGAGGVFSDLTLISNGTGHAIKNSAGTRSPSAIINCSGNVTYDASITPTANSGNLFNAAMTQ